MPVCPFLKTGDYVQNVLKKSNEKIKAYPLVTYNSPINPSLTTKIDTPLTIETNTLPITENTKKTEVKTDTNTTTIDTTEEKVIFNDGIGEEGLDCIKHILKEFPQIPIEFYNFDKYLPAESEVDISDLVAEVDKKFEINS